MSVASSFKRDATVRIVSVAFVRENPCRSALKTRSEAAEIHKAKPDVTASCYRPPSTAAQQCYLNVRSSLTRSA